MGVGFWILLMPISPADFLQRNPAVIYFRVYEHIFENDRKNRVLAETEIKRP